MLSPSVFLSAFSISVYLPSPYLSLHSMLTLLSLSISTQSDLSLLRGICPLSAISSLSESFSLSLSLYMCSLLTLLPLFALSLLSAFSLRVHLSLSFGLRWSMLYVDWRHMHNAHAHVLMRCTWHTHNDKKSTNVTLTGAPGIRTSRCTS